MDDIFVYAIDLPPSIHEYIMPCADGYTVYINRNLCERKRFEAFEHAMTHIRNGDFDRFNVQEIECSAHGI